jgi:peptidyl-prolyl cis-trans isomerase SurA
VIYESCLFYSSAKDDAGQSRQPRESVKKTSPTAVRARFRAMVTAALAAAALVALGSAAWSQQVALFVDGEPITELDIAHRQKFIEMSTRKVPGRQETIDSLIDEILEIREAKRFGIEPSKQDVDDSYAGVATNMGADAQKLTQILSNGGASEDTLKHRLKAQIAWSSLVRGRYKVSLEVTDTDVAIQMALHDSGDTAQVGYEYNLRPVVMVVPRGSGDAAFEARKKEADALRVRFVTCTEGVPFARGLHEVAVGDPIIKSSADLQQELRDILDKTEVGHLTPPEQTGEGIQMFAVCSKRESKNDTPSAKKLRDEMFEKKFGAKARRYLADLRRAAMIEYKSAQH